MKYKHIVWDWNGTLVDDTWLFVDIMNGVLKDRNLIKIFYNSSDVFTYVLSITSQKSTQYILLRLNYSIIKIIIINYIILIFKMFNN